MLSRIFRGDSENAAVNRKRQIDTLKVFNDNVTEVQEDVEYKVEFNAGGRSMAILVSLKPEFPLDKPVLKVTPQISHPWVNDQSEVTSAPGLLNFTVHSDLGRVVQAIIREFEKRPPRFTDEATAIVTQSIPTRDMGTNGRSTPPYTMPVYTGGTSSFTDHGAQTQSLNRQLTTPFPELADMTNSELEQLNQNEDRIAEIVDSLPPMQKLYKQLDDMITRNEELAKENLAKQPELERLKKNVLEKLDAVSSLKNSYENLSHEYQKLSEEYAPQNIKESLRLAAMKSDEESERVAEMFLCGEIDVDQFVNSYVQKRMLSQMRKTKEEKLGHQLEELQRASY